jgi:hypothetical protein
MRKGIVGLVIIMALAVGTAAFAADWGTDTTAIYKRDAFTLNIGAMFASFGTSATLHSTYYGRGTTLDFQRDLGVDDAQTLLRLDGTWRFTPRQQLYFSYINMDQSGSKDLSRTIQWGDNIYYTGATVKGDINTWQTNLYYRFSFVQGDKGEFGGSIGVSYFDMSASLEGWGQVAGTMHSYYAKREGSIGAPVPVIGLFGTWQFHPQWSLSADINYLKLNIDNIDGEYTDARVNLDYFPWKNYGFGLGYLYNDINVESDKTSWNGGVDYSFDGFLAYFKFRF